MLYLSILVPLLLAAGVAPENSLDEDDNSEPNTEPDQDVTDDGSSTEPGSDIEDIIFGDDDDNELFGTDGADTVYAEAGDDRVETGRADDLIEGGAGADTLLGGFGTDLVEGGSGDDVVKGGLGNDFLFGGEGDDTVVGSGGDDVMSAGSGSDFLKGGDGDDFMFAIEPEGALGEADTLVGGLGNDRLWGDDGDSLTGGEGVNRFEITIGVEGAEPVVITDLDLFHDETAELRTDLVSFLDADGNLLTRAELLDGGARLEDSEDGQDAHVYFEGELAAIIEGYTSEDLQADTNWIGNLSPHLTGRFDGNDVIAGDDGGAVVDDELFGGPGDDTLTGGGGSDFLRGNEGDDVLDGRDSDMSSAAPDSLAGGEGDDQIIADDGDLVAGMEGTDSFEIVVPDSDEAAPVRIFGYETQTEDGLTELLTLVGADGTPLSAEDVAANLVIYQSAEGDEAVLEYDGRQIAHLDGIDADSLQDQSLWIGNFDPDPAIGLSPTAGSFSSDAQISMSLQSASATGNVVNAEMFGANAIYSVNTDLGVPLENYVAAVDALDVLHVRYPAGQADPETPEEEGTRWLNIMELEENENGDLDLRPEVTAALDAVIAAHNNGVDVKLTLATPTKIFSVEEYEAMYDDMALFAELVVTRYGDAVDAFEIGNEYWIQGETAYGQKADIAARAFGEGMANAGLDPDDQPSIIVQMATPNNGSEFHSSVDDRPFGARRDDANQQIVDQLSEEAREEIDGVVEHYYYNKHYDAFTDDGNERGFIDSDKEIWDAEFDKELDLHITEWNIRTTNFPQNGMRSAGIVAEQFENMIDMGADAAHGWPAVHNTATHLAGTRSDMPIVDDQDRVLNSVRGAMFDVMSTELVGTELVDTVFTNDDGRMEIQTYQSEDKVVFQVVSRTDEAVELDLDVSAMVPEFESVSGVRIGYDTSADSSDGIYRDGDGNLVNAEYSIIDGEQYYFNEFDVRATITDEEYNSNELLIRLKPYEVVQITFDLGENPPDAADPGESINGTDEADLIVSGNGNDSINGLGGDDTILSNGGIDEIFGGLGNDSLEGGKGDDYVRGEEGDDAIYGFGGDDDMKGHDGDDSISGNQGNDTLSGSKGYDLLRGGDGEDSLNGGVGTDTLAGGEGRDTLTGWSGTDIFRFSGEDMVEGDLITDFEVGADVIELEYDDITSVSDLVFQNVDGGVVVYVGDHGGLYLQGELTAAQVNDARNFAFV